MQELPIKIAIFASGTGTNAEKIIKHFQSSSTAEVALLVSNRKEAGALDKARHLGVPTQVVNRDTFYESGDLLEVLQDEKISWIVLAGFLWLVPSYLIQVYPNKIINIHPALLPKFGGKGMYGSRVHRAVFQKKEKETGITIHFVNEVYDEGEIIFQAKCPILEEDTPDTIARKVQTLEHKHFPRVLEDLIMKSIKN